MKTANFYVTLFKQIFWPAQKNLFMTSEIAIEIYQEVEWILQKVANVKGHWTHNRIGEKSEQKKRRLSLSIVSSMRFFFFFLKKKREGKTRALQISQQLKFRLLYAR